MRIEQLEYIEAVTRYGSLRRTSEHLHISQPALSESISRLERDLGVTLLDRRRSGARISRRGRELLSHMTDAIDAVRRLREAASAEANHTRVVHVGTVQAANSTLLVPALRLLRHRSPGVNVEIRNLQQRDIFTETAEGALDLGLVNLLDGDDVPTDLSRTDLIHGTPVVVMPRSHPLAAMSQVSREQLDDEPFVVMRSGYLMNRVLARWLGRIPRTCYTADGAELGMTMTAEGLGVTVLPDFTVLGHPLHSSGSLVCRQLAEPAPTVTLVACQRQGAATPLPVRELHAALARRAQEYTRDGVTAVGTDPGSR